MQRAAVNTDVLVIGGGGAGLLAAIEARQAGAEVTIICKKETAKSGCTPYAVTNITKSTSESEQELFRQMVEVGGYLNDQELLEVFVREVARVVPGLSQYGVPLAVADGTHYHLVNYPHGPQKHLPGIYNVQPGPGRPLSFNLTLPLREAAEKMGIRILDKVLATRILVSEDSVAGVTALDLEGGRLMTISSKAVVLATGGGSRIFERTDNPVDLTGEGFSLAFHAGADLINMELILINPLKMSDDVLDMIRSGQPSDKVMAMGRAHYNLGGVKTDSRGESTVRNLFAAGEVADGLLGAGRLGGTALADAIVFGTIAGREAGGRAVKAKRLQGLDEQEQAEEERIAQMTRSGLPPAELQKDLKALMWKQAGPVKDEEGLRRAAQRLDEMKNLSMAVRPDDPRELGQAIETRGMVWTAYLIVLASLQRRETRGQFWRLDYPKPDNANCLFNVILSGRGETVDISKRPPPVTRLRTPSEHPLVGSGCYNYLRPLE
jgi:succinate dehydrogenase/fumarate reductase flavoprotein subunit